MKKILIVTGIFPPDIGGPATYCEIIANALTKNDFNVHVITYSSIRIPKEKRDFKIERVWKKWPWFIRHLIYSLKVFSNASKNDIIYSLSTLNGGIPSLISARMFKKKFFIRIAGDYAWQVAMEKRRTSLLIDDFQKAAKHGWVGFLFWLQKLLCKKADTVIVPSDYLKSIVADWGVPSDKIKVVYNSTDFKPAPASKEEARNKIGIHGNIIVSVGRLVPWKGFKMLVKIMPQVLNISQFLRLVIIGDGPEKKVLEIMVKNLGLDKKVYLVGKKSQADIAWYLAASDMFVLNSGYEGFSHQILEAMAAGVPVMVSAVLGNREIIHQGQNGFMVKYNDEFNIIEAIKTIYQDAELREQFIKEGKKTAEFFSVDRMLRETIKILSN